MEAITSTRTVVKHNHLIDQLVLEWYRLPAIAQKMVTVIVSMIYTKEKTMSTYRIPFKDLYYYLGLENCKDANKMIRTAVKKINRQPIIENREIMIYWFSSIQFLPDGQIEFEFSDKLGHYLVGLKGSFTRYRLNNILSMKKAYPIRMYELLKQYQAARDRTFELSELKGLLGVPPGGYQDVKDFKKKVINRCQTVLYEKTDIGFTYTPLKKEKGSKRITHFRFNIFNNEKTRPAKIAADYKATVTQIVQAKQAYEIPDRSINSPAFNNAYKTFKDNPDNFPEDWSFSTYVEQTGNFRIERLPGGGKDLVPTKLFD